MSTKLRSFKELTNDVVRWNSIGRKVPPTEEQQAEIVWEEIEEYTEAIAEQNQAEQNRIEIFDAISDTFFTNEYMKFLYPANLVGVVAEAILDQGLSKYPEGLIIECIEEVIRSNYTKFVKATTYEDHLDNIIKYLKDMEATYNTEITAQHNKGYTVFLNKNNKILKPKGYEPPNLDVIISKYLDKGE